MVTNLGDLSEGMGMICRRRLVQTARSVSCERGYVLFRRGEKAHVFYALIEGEIELISGDGDLYHRVCRPGDIFGWGGLADTTCSETAICTARSETLLFDCQLLCELLKKYPDDGALFFIRLGEGNSSFGFGPGSFQPDRSRAGCFLEV